MRVFVALSGNVLYFYILISGKSKLLPSPKRSNSPHEYGVSKRRRSLDSISSISSSSLDRSPTGRGFDPRKNFANDRDVIYVRSESRSLSPNSRNPT